MMFGSFRPSTVHESARDLYRSPPPERAALSCRDRALVVGIRATSTESVRENGNSCKGCALEAGFKEGRWLRRRES